MAILGNTRNDLSAPDVSLFILSIEERPLGKVLDLLFTCCMGVEIIDPKLRDLADLATSSEHLY